MNQAICEFSFNLTAWNVVCNKVLSLEDWKLGESHWQQNSASWEDFAPKLAFLPPLKRRRLSDSARLFFEAAWELTGQDENLPVVYASSNSEINRSFSLWHSLLAENEISPTSFSLSVHNALVGQWSEMRQIKAEINALSAQKDNLEIALLEAYLLLKDGYQRVLVVIAESPLYAEYNATPVERQPFSYALAMIIEKGEQFQLTLQAEQSQYALPQLDNALTWVQQQYLSSSQWQTQSSRGGLWQWWRN